MGGECFARIETGPCHDDLDCVSGICGPDAAGNCCATPCNSTFEECGATECDRVTGACLYADAGTPCGSVRCTPGSQADPSFCDGLGHCDTYSCAPYLCGLDACLTRCESGGLFCIPGAFCEVDLLACCSGLDDGANIHVDWLAGSDATPCCGFAGAPPCQTLTHAMSLIEAAGAHNVTLIATVGSDGGDWPLDIESSPFTLGGGLELVAPGVYFQNIEIATAPSDTFSESASIVGTAAHPVVIGISTTGDTSNTTASIVVQPGNTLYIANARLYSDPSDFTSALDVLGGATVVLGQDQSAGVTGTVYVGDPAIAGANGVECEGGGNAYAQGCTISDAPLSGMNSVVIQNEAGSLFYAWSASSSLASISLASAPIFGEAPSSTGFGKCPAKSGNGIELDGNVSMTLENGTVQCLDGFGVELDNALGPSFLPSLMLSHTTIQNTDTGLLVSAGNATISSSILRYNYVGVWEATNGSNPSGTVDLSGGGNSVVCTSSSEASPYQERAFPAMAVLNTTSATLNASNVSWDTAGPDQFMCDPTGTICTCELPSCTNPGGVDGMDAVDMSTGTITTTGNELSLADCTPPPLCASGDPCPSGQVCCADFDYCLPFPCPD